MTHLIPSFSGTYIKVSSSVSELKNWKNNNPNPLVSVAKECLDTILNRFNLAVQTEIVDVQGIKSLQIRSLSEDITIPYEHLSTGTKQIIFTAFPIYQLLQDDSIVLMDEPETSLYPDIQGEIIPLLYFFDKNKTLAVFLCHAFAHYQFGL
ncbi:MAG: ATP-binding protein [Saprospiraceae bacterium]|nr:ATP-binding protein [Saprospiraceae bacterium]